MRTVDEAVLNTVLEKIEKSPVFEKPFVNLDLYYSSISLWKPEERRDVWAC
jgi:hypothetical protein